VTDLIQIAGALMIPEQVEEEQEDVEDVEKDAGRNRYGVVLAWCRSSGPSWEDWAPSR
jgi:hypothetical protein